MIKVLIVDDSLTIRKKIAEVVAGDPEFAIVGEASDGKVAISLLKSVSPDLIIMDLVMPIMDGQEATEKIMASRPIPILIHSSSANRGEDYKTMDALSAGALDFLEKNSENWEEELVFRIKRAARIKVITHLNKKRRIVKNVDLFLKSPSISDEYNLLVIGASTGGPKVVLDILSRFPSDFPIPVVVVIHMTGSFRNSLCDWLNNNTSIDVIIPDDGEPFMGKSGIVFMAPPGRHLVVEDGCFRLISSPMVNFCCPSIDVLFESVAKNREIKAMGVLLTGMGKDGAAGLKAIKDNGGYTIAQDEATSIVFGMPKEAIDIGGVTRVLPASGISEEIINRLKVRG